VPDQNVTLTVEPAVLELCPLELDVLVFGEWVEIDVTDRVLGDARADPHQGAEIIDRREHHPIYRQLLDLVEDLRALLGIALGCLLEIELVDVGIAAPG